MRSRLRYLATLALLLMPYQLLLDYDAASPQLSASIYCRVVDANTGLPIENATILAWDMNTLKKPTLGAGIYFTDENGEYSISGEYVKGGHTYWIYAYKGDFAAKKADYVPAFTQVHFQTIEDKNLSFSLIPGALIEVEGTPYLVQSPSPGANVVFIRVLTDKGFNVPFIDEYGSAQHVWFLGLGKGTVIVPANAPVALEASAWFYSRETRRIGKEIFPLYNGSMPFLLYQGQTTSSQISRYSLRGGLEYVESKFVDTSSQVDRAQSVGFVVFDERNTLIGKQEDSVANRINKASSILSSAQSDLQYLEVWTILGEAIGTMDVIYNTTPETDSTLERMLLIAETSAVYLSAVLAAFSVVLAFFFFDQRKGKMFSSAVIYITFLIVLYFTYPGAHIVIDENAPLFLQSATTSFLAVSAFVFGLPRLWKERSIEGEVSWKSAVSVIFSMGKRQIRRKKIRGTFTILSVIILVLAFTSLTSFGTLFGIVSERWDATAPSDGVMVKRMLNETSLRLSPLGSGDAEALARVIALDNVAVRLESIPSANPTARLVSTETGTSWFIYGILAISPRNETQYIALDWTVEGNFPSEARDDEILVSESVANNLGIKAGENLTLEVLNTRVSSSFTVAGVVDDERYMSLVDMDGAPYGPARLLPDGSERRCNSTEIAILSWKAADKVQRSIDIEAKEERKEALQLVVPTEIVFELGLGVSTDLLLRTLIYGFTYDVFISTDNVITYYHVGELVEAKGIAELLIPLVMVGLNVSMVMMNSVYERRKEIRTLSMVGLNPTHIGLIFVAEAIILGMVGGSLGYLAGLGFYRVMVLFGQELMVREKLEWWWSAIGFAIALAASVLSSIRPAALAVSTYTPSKVKKVKRSDKEAIARKDEIFKAYQERQMSMPVKVALNEKIFFIGFFLDRLDDLRTGYIERVENVEETPEMENVRGELVKTINFDYRYETGGRERKTKNSLVLTKNPDEDYYRVRIASEPAVPGVPVSAIERTIDFVHDTVIYWTRNKKRIVGTL